MATKVQLLARRAKLEALALRGVDGEQQAAMRKLAAFDKAHPELRPTVPGGAAGHLFGHARPWCGGPCGVWVRDGCSGSDERCACWKKALAF